MGGGGGGRSGMPKVVKALGEIEKQFSTFCNILH